MKVAFISNFYNHHQAPFSEAMDTLTEGNYRFIATEPISEERLQMGWGEDKIPDFVSYSYRSPEEKAACQAFVDEADVAIVGSAPRSWVARRLAEGKLTFYYSERIYKEGVPYHKLPVHFLKNLKRITRHKNLYLLCASAYTASDYAKSLTFLGKTYKWGYFPAVKKYDDIENLITAKKKGSLLWVARFIDWKHPELALSVATQLKKEGYDFSLTMIGAGELLEQTKATVREWELEDCVHILGPVKADEVRVYMEESEIFLFTSDRGEGWGAVLNESMNSGCAVVADHAIGSVPFLLENGKNGFIYEDGNADDLYRKVKWLLDHSEERTAMGRAAYRTMAEEWNAENAAKKLLVLSEQLMKAPKARPFDTGVCSEAKRLRDNWFSSSKQSL